MSGPDVSEGLAAGDPVAAMVTQILAAGRRTAGPGPAVVGAGSLPSVFAVTPLAVASIGAAAMTVADLLERGDGRRRAVTVDRRLASMWFAGTLRPRGWALPPLWDAVAGDYPCADGWIRLHTNAPAHREAVLAVLGAPANRDAVTRAVAGWAKGDLEARVVEAGGCAAAMRTHDEWRSSPQGRGVAAEPLIAWEAGDQCAPLAVAKDVTRPLAGVRVLDLTRVLAGPVATRFLALLGADVLRIDPPWWDEPGVVPEVLYGKRTATLDLTRSEDRERLLGLLAEADVLVHGYRPGALDRLGLGDEVRRRARPGLIDVSLGAYGRTGPWRERRGFDSLVQMSTGIADAGRRAQGGDRPVPLPVQALDHATGYLMAYAVVDALADRAATGRGATARLSLARTAALLTGCGPEDVMDPLAPEAPTDVAPEIEGTSWGPACRLVAPVVIEGVVLAAYRAARMLGADTPRW